MPVRTCVGCRRTVESDALLRLQADRNGVLSFSGKLGGRGAWICLETLGQCFDNAINRGSLQRGLRTELNVDSVKRLQETVQKEIDVGILGQKCSAVK